MAHNLQIDTITFLNLKIKNMKGLDKNKDVTMTFSESNRAAIINEEVLLMPIMP